MLPHETACKAGTFLVEPHPRSAYAAQVAPVLPRTWMILEIALHGWCATCLRIKLCGPPGPADGSRTSVRRRDAVET